MPGLRILTNKKRRTDMDYDTWAEINGVEPECDSCIHYSPAFGCRLEKDGIECDGMSEFCSDGR
jgi:hypothetical protein